MKVRVLKPFRDKHTKKIYAENQEIDVTKKRYSEIVKNLSESHVEVVTEPQEDKPEEG